MLGLRLKCTQQMFFGYLLMTGVAIAWSYKDRKYSLCPPEIEQACKWSSQVSRIAMYKGQWLTEEKIRLLALCLH
jgi:hypothetical protein